MEEFKIENPHEIHESDFKEMLIKGGDLEVFSKGQIDAYLDQMGDLLVKGETDELCDDEKKQIEISKSEVGSFQKFLVTDDNYNKSLQFIRQRQIEWETTPTGDILKGECGTFRDTELNRKLERVGEKWMSPSYAEKQSQE